MRIRNTKAFLISAAVTGMITAVLLTGIFDVVKMQGNTMVPEIENGKRLLISKLAYLCHQPEPGDVVTFLCNVYSEDGEGSHLIRRIAAVEGDRVQIKNGNLYVNGVLYEGYREQSMYLEPMDEIKIGKNRVFVLADTKTAILDSRDQAIGQLRLDEITGKVCFE